MVIKVKTWYSSWPIPICNCSFSNILRNILTVIVILKTWKLETGSRQDTTALSCRQFLPLLIHAADIDKTKQFCLVRVGGVNGLWGFLAYWLVSCTFALVHSYVNWLRSVNLSLKIIIDRLHCTVLFATVNLSANGD